MITIIGLLLIINFFVKSNKIYLTISYIFLFFIIIASLLPIKEKNVSNNMFFIGSILYSINGILFGSFFVSINYLIKR